MPTTERVLPATPEIIARQRALIAGAAEERKLAHERIEREAQEKRAQVNGEFVTKVNEARRLRVPWKDIEGAAGISRQMLDRLVNGRS